MVTCAPFPSPSPSASPCSSPDRSITSPNTQRQTPGPWGPPLGHADWGQVKMATNAVIRLVMPMCADSTNVWQPNEKTKWDGLGKGGGLEKPRVRDSSSTEQFHSDGRHSSSPFSLRLWESESQDTIPVVASGGFLSSVTLLMFDQSGLGLWCATSPYDCFPWYSGPYLAYLSVTFMFPHTSQQR